MDKTHAAVSLFFGALLGLSPDAGADSIAAAAGYGDHAEIAALALQFDRAAPLREYRTARLTAQAELGAGYLRGHAGWTNNNELAAIGATPVLRLEFPNGGAMPFVEGGIGIRFLSDTRIYDSRRFSTSFQFGELIGIGLRYGEGRQYEIGLRFEHISNGGIKRPNDGLNFAVVRFAYHYN